MWRARFHGPAFFCNTYEKENAIVKKIWLIRHGESTANAGAATEDHRTIPLSPLGEEQAKAVSLIVPRPDLIITSPYARARQTAAPLCRLYPDVPVEVWPSVHEFVYLSPCTCVGTTSAQRRPRVIAYWRNLDPDYVDAGDAESYRDLVSRITETLSALEKRREHFIVIFTHAQFIRNLLLVRHEPGLAAAAYMRRFLHSPAIKNGQIVEITLP